MIERDDRLSPDEAELAAALARVRGEDLPSPALDAVVLSMARNALATSAGGPGSPPLATALGPMAASGRRRPRARVAAGLGIAASVLLAAGLSWQLRPQPDDAIVWSEAAPGQAMQDDAPAAAEMAASPAADAPMADASAPGEPAASATAASNEEQRARAVPSTGPAPGPRERRSEEGEQAMADPGEAAAPQLRARRAPAPPAPPPPPPPAASAPVPMPADTAAVATTAPSADAAPRRDASMRAGAEQAARAARAAEAAPRDMQRRIDAVGSAPPAPVAEDAAQWDQPFDEQPPASADSPDVRRAWLARIRELMDSEQYQAARASLAEFQRRYPDDALPAELAPLQE